MKFYIKRVNQVGNEFFLGLSGEWHHGSVAGPGGYKVVTYKTEAGAFRRADRFATAYPGQRIVVMTDEGGTHEVERGKGTLPWEKAYHQWQRLCEAAMRRSMRHGAESITDFNRRNERIRTAKAKYERLLAAHKGRPYVAD